VGIVSSSLESSGISNRSLIQVCGFSEDLSDKEVRPCSGLVGSEVAIDKGGDNGAST
jgi:hypothetical protein